MLHICGIAFSLNTAELKKESSRLQSEMELVEEMIQTAIAENARIALDQQVYKQRFDELSKMHDALNHQHDDIESQIADKTSRRVAMRQFISTLNKQPALVTEFDPTLWGVLLDHVTIHEKDDVRFTFKDGTEIKA